MDCVRSSRRRFYNQSSIDSSRVEKGDLVTPHHRPGGDGRAEAQRATAQRCPPTGWTLTRLDALKRDGFKMPDTFQRHELAIALTGCLGDPNPEIRDGIAFEALSTWMRAGQLDLATLQTAAWRSAEDDGASGRRRLRQLVCGAGALGSGAHRSAEGVDVRRKSATAMVRAGAPVPLEGHGLSRVQRRRGVPPRRGARRGLRCCSSRSIRRPRRRSSIT